MEEIVAVGKFLTNNLKINIAGVGSNYAGVYDARVEDVRAESVLISMPTDAGRPMSVSAGMKIEASFIMTGGRYLFTTTVKGRVMENIQMLVLERPKKLLKSELREFFRVDVLQKAKLFSVEDVQNEGKTMPIKTELGTVLCLDISGGGTKLLSSIDIPHIVEVAVDFSGFIEGLSSVAGRVVRYIHKPDGKFDIGIKFTSLRDSDRDKIIKYVFKRQIEMRKMGK